MQVWSSNKDAKTCRIVVLISGNGSNLQAIMDHCTKGSIPAEVTAVISNVASAFGLTRARQAGITSHCLDHRDFANRLEYDLSLIHI